MRTLVSGVDVPFAGVFYYGRGFLDINRYRVNIITVVYEINNSRNRKGQ
jgi:hypothetical protein